MIHWTMAPTSGLHHGHAEPSERQYMVIRIPAGWHPHVWRSFNTPMSNDLTDPTPYVPEAAGEGWSSLSVGISETVDEAMTACEENEHRLEDAA